MINEICDRIEGADYFGWLLNQMTDVSEILGPFSIKEMENDRFMRVTTGKLPEAEIAFLDEVYKSNTPTLNALLTIMNEKVFYNDGKPITVPLFSLFGASNEPPAEESLMALHDRFLFRAEVGYLNDSGNIKSMCTDFIRKRGGNINPNKTTITMDEIRAMQDAAEKMPVTVQIINSYVTLLSKFKNSAKLIISDRRKNECLKVLQGSAVFRGGKTVTVDDFKLLPYALWEEPDQLPIIQTEIAKIKSPNEDEFIKIKDRFEKIKDSMEKAMTDEEKMTAAIANKVAVTQIIAKLNSIIIQSSGDNVFAETVEKFKTEATNYVSHNMEQYMTMFGM